MTDIIKISSGENKEFYRKTFSLVIPMALQNLINVGVTAADTIMLGYIDEAAISAVSLANQIAFILILIVFGVTSGAGILTSQYWGKQNMKAIEKILAISLSFSVIVSVCFTIASAFFPTVLMKAYSSDPHVIELGAVYLRFIGITYIIGTISTIYFNTLRSMENVVISTVVYTISLIINIGINALLMFGLFGLPKLGVVGAAIGTICARCFELIVVTFLAFKKNSILRIIPEYFLKIDKELLIDFIKYSSPVIINEMFWGLATSANSAIIGHLSTQAAAANAITMVIKQLAQVISLGVAMATAIILGKMIGENEIARAKLYSVKFIRLSLILATISSIGIFLIRPLPAKYMVLTQEAASYLSHMLLVLMFAFIAQAFNTTMIVGVFRAGGDSKFGLMADLLSMWFFSVPMGILAGFILKWDIRIVYIFLLSDEFLKVPVCYLRYKTNIWLKDVTRNLI